MAGKTNTSATFFAQKKLLGKAHTSNLKTDGEELIGSNIQAATSLTFGESIPVSASLNLYTIQSASNGAPGTIEYVPFILTALTGTTYDANNTNPDGGSGQDSGESSQVSGPHAYKFVFPSDYVANSSNDRKGNGFFNNNKIVHETLGKVQLVPPFFSQQAPNPYIVKIYKDDGSGGVGDEIPLLDNIDWNVDYYNGVLFLQDYNASKIPAHAKAFAYVGKMADEVITSGGGGGGGSGDTGAQYLVLSSTGSLSNERVFTAGTGLSTDDAGANGNFTVGIKDSIVATISGSTFTGDLAVHKSSPVFGIQRTNNNQNSDISFKGTGGQIGARLRFSGSQSNDLVFSTFTGSTLKERVRIRSNLPDVAVEVTGSLRTTLGISGSLTRLSDGTSFIKSSGNVSVVSESNGSITISTPNFIFNEYIGQANGTNTLFSLSKAPTTARDVAVYVNGLLQMPATSITSAPFQDYSITGSNIYFTSGSAPFSGSLLMANYTTNT